MLKSNRSSVITLYNIKIVNEKLNKLYASLVKKNRF